MCDGGKERAERLPRGGALWTVVWIIIWRLQKGGVWQSCLTSGVGKLGGWGRGEIRLRQFCPKT